MATTAENVGGLSQSKILDLQSEIDQKAGGDLWRLSDHGHYSCDGIKGQKAECFLFAEFLASLTPSQLLYLNYEPKSSAAYSEVFSVACMTQ